MSVTFLLTELDFTFVIISRAQKNRPLTGFLLPFEIAYQPH